MYTPSGYRLQYVSESLVTNRASVSYLCKCVAMIIDANQQHRPKGHYACVRLLGGAEVMMEPRSQVSEWLPVSAGVPDGDLEVGIVDYDGLIVALPYPCHRSGGDFVDAANSRRLDIQLTHWRQWTAPRKG